MENSCISMANPGKCGFFLLGMFFMLAFASWTIVNRSQEAQEVVSLDAGTREHDSRQEVGHQKESQKKTDTIYQDLLEKKNYRQGILQDRINTHLIDSGVTEKVESGEVILPLVLESEEDDIERIPTFLGALDNSFTNLHPDENNEIPTLPWLKACEGPKELLTGLGSIMTKVWSDVGGNLKILQERYNSNPAEYSTLQKIVYVDIENGVAPNSGSAAMAVLWLKRAFDFVAEFFDNIKLGKDPPAAGTDAYASTLAKHHSFFLRPIFYGAMKMLGSKQDVFSAMALHEEDLENSAFELNAFKDIDKYTTALRLLLANLDDFLTENDLNS